MKNCFLAIRLKSDFLDLTGAQIDGGMNWEESMKNKEERIQKVNQLIQTIALCGRKFFSTAKFNRISRFELAENGRLYFWDKYTNERLPLSHNKSRRWEQYFTEGGTLKRLVEQLANHIKTGKPITNQYVFGPWEDWMCKGDLWGYGDDMEIVRKSAKELGIYKVDLTSA